MTKKRIITFVFGSTALVTSMCLFTFSDAQARAPVMNMDVFEGGPEKRGVFLPHGCDFGPDFDIDTLKNIQVPSKGSKNPKPVKEAVVLDTQKIAQLAQPFVENNEEDVNAGVLLGNKSNIATDSVLEDVEKTTDLMTRMASEPLVTVEEDGTKKINPHFQEQKQTLLKMNSLSYAISKRQSASDEMNKWGAALNSNARNYADFQKYIDTEFGGSMDMFDVLEEMDFEDRRSYINSQIQRLEGYILGQVADEQALADEIYSNGWELKAFEGMSGYRRALGNSGDNWVEDDRGFVAFHKATNTITVIYHGSRDGSDWAANFDGMKVNASKTGLSLPGDVEVHRGFANLAASCKDNVAALVREFHAGVDEKKKSTTSIYVSGHSLGAAIATLSTLELAHNVGPELFGEGFDNKKTNNFKGFYLSTPRAVSASGARAFEEVVGTDNVIRQNVHGDPVPMAAMKTITARLQSILKWVEGGRQPGTTGLAKIPFIGNWLEGKMFDVLKNPQFKVFVEESLEDALGLMSGYESVGHLALDDTGETITRMLLPATKAFALRTGANFVGMIKGYWGALVGNGTPNPGITGFVKNTVVDAVSTVVAPLHYGTTLAGAGGAFDYNLPGNDTESLLNNGKTHLETKASEKKSWGSRVKSGVIKTAKAVKRTVDSWVSS